MNKKDSKKLIILYSCIYLLMVGIIAAVFYLNGKSLIAYGGDGFREYYQSLIHYSGVLKEIVNNIFINHKFVIPQMDFSIGEGNDLLQTMHFILVGDPMYALSVFIPKEYMYIFFDITNLLKIYLAGLSFIYLCKVVGKTNWVGILVGTISYSFCGYSIATLTTHPFFLNTLIVLPLIIAGIEKLLKGEKPYLLIFSVFGAALSNLYFFYMIVILVIVYSVVRIVLAKEKFIKLISIGIYSFIGVLLAGVIVVPMFYTLITNSRVSIERTYASTYPFSYFVDLLSNHVTNNYQNYYGGFGLLSVFALAIMIKKQALIVLCYLKLKTENTFHPLNN